MSAVAEIPVVNTNPSTSVMEKLSKLDRSQRMRMGIGVALLVLLCIAGIFFSQKTDYKVLYANLSEKDGGAIVAQLTQMNVPYKYTEGGGAITVPADRVYDVRLRLASLGLPKGSVTGFELMESNRFGMTQFQERLTFQRGLEGELTRSIQGLTSVSSARVHLALPNQNGFFREQQKPSASVLLSLHPGRTLDRAQIAGIVHLVSSSVPEMTPSAVSVLDDTGKLLSQSPDGTPGAGGADAEQLQYAQKLEQQYTQRIIDILAPIVGRENVKAQVSAEVDFSQTESTSEQHRPNLATDASAVRSQQVVETSGPAGGTGPSGVPGAVSNQPPVQANAPVNGQVAPLQAAGQPGAGAANAQVKRESVTNYEVDKTVRVVRGGTGAVKRLSAAVVVNYQSVVDDKGVATPKALTEQQITQMTELVRQSIGFSQERGDSVNMMNAPFLSDVAAVDNTPLWRQPATLELARSLAWPIGVVLLVALILFGFVRPGLKAMAAPKEVAVDAEGNIIPGGLDALVADENQRPALTGPDGQPIEDLSPSAHQLRMDEARKLAKENPVAVAAIIKTWINGDEGG